MPPDCVALDDGISGFGNTNSPNACSVPGHHGNVFRVLTADPSLVPVIPNPVVFNQLVGGIVSRNPQVIIAVNVAICYGNRGIGANM